jgi:ubiquinone/menaquinone biosynthesis C-methylase UbiE
MSQYLFDNAASQASQRFESLAALYDPITVRHLEALEVSDGWVCWEIGGGGGSIADWLASRVGTEGHVLVTDIDPCYLTAFETQAHANMQVQRHDVGLDPLPAMTFDLIHARLVFTHVPTAAQALHQVTAALKPGGWLLVEDFDPVLIDVTFPAADRAPVDVYAKMRLVVTQLLALHGRSRDWARGLYQRLRAEGLVEVGMEGHLAVWPGGTAGARLMQANFGQVRAEAVERGLITEHEIEQALALLDDPIFAVSSPVMFSAWGRHPAA